MRTVTSRDFEEAVLRQPGLVVVMFYTSYCPFYEDFAPVFEEFAAKVDARFVKADITDDADPLWERYGIRAVPTAIVFRDGKPVARRDSPLGVGLSRADFVSLLREVGVILR